MKTQHLMAFAFAACAACGTSDPADPTSDSPDAGVDDGTKPEEAPAQDGKFDRWDYASDPDRFEGGLEHTLAALPREGRASSTPWPSTYWPTYEDSVQARWNGELSPAEKYDRAFNGWTPPENFAALRPYNAGSCAPGSWDAAYYAALGPLATHVSTNMGNARARDGVDSDADGQTDECDDFDGVATWWGLCHAWVPAALREDRPMRSVTHNGVTFHVGDLEALLILAYNRSNANMIGSRCNLFDTREAMARAYGCRLPDQTAASGDGRSECTAAQLDSYVIRRDEHGRIEQGQCRDTNAGALHVIMSNYLGLQQRAFAEDRTWDSEVWNQPVVAFKIERLDEVAATVANERLGVSGATYAFNPDAAKLYDVTATLTYITESHASTTAADASRFERTDRYTYILEVDAAGEVIGGEYYGAGRQLHPDFLWDPQRLTRTSVPHLDLEQVRMLVQMSRQPEAPVAGAAGEISVAGTGGAIPDNSATGLARSVEVAQTGAVAALRLTLAVDHTYAGDLTFSLAHGGKTVVVRDRVGGSDDDVRVTIPVAGFEGLAANGTWTLTVVDTAAQDVGTLEAWTLHVVPGATAPAPTGALTARGAGGAIPDNTPSGFSETVTVTGSGAVASVVVDYKVSHTYIGDLRVVLAHGGREHVLHDRVGGSRADLDGRASVTTFNGLEAAGAWTLAVVDGAGQDVGSVTGWGVAVTTGTPPPLEPEPAVGAPETFPGNAPLAIPDNDPAGVSSAAAVPSGMTGSRVAVGVTVRHTYRSDLMITVSHGAQTWTLTDRQGDDADDYVETVVLDPAPAGALGGTWTLKIVDAAAEDVGTLEAWNVTVTP